MRKNKILPMQLMGAFVLLTTILLLLNVPVFARQTEDNGGDVLVFPVDLSQFPGISFYFTAFDMNGRFIDDLTVPDIQLLENGHTVKIDQLDKVEPGMQMTLAINPSPLMLNKTAGNLTVYERLRDTVIHWSQTHPSGTPDDFSISTPEGLSLLRDKDPNRWIQALMAYQPEFKPTQLTLNSLTQALDLGTDPNSNPYMKRSILYITGLPTNEQLASMANLTDRASQMGIRITVWLVSAQGDSTILENSIPLADMAKRTGGSFFIYTGTEDLPDYNADLESSRYMYHVTYSSMTHQSGQQQLGIHIGRSDLNIDAQPVFYDVNIQPPNPIFLAPPNQISRSLLPMDGEKDKPPEYDIKEMTLKILLEFPDGHPRQIKVSRLFVDNKLVAQNEKPPFDEFRWDLEPYTETSRLMVRVEVEDTMGITSSSIETPIDMIIKKPEEFSLARLIPGEGTSIMIALFVAGGVLLLVLFIPAIRSRFGFLNTEKQKLERDPLTQPVRISQERRPAASHSPTVPRSLVGLSAPARLLRLSETGHPIPSSAILLNRREMTFGSDGGQVTNALNDPSVSPKHSRLVYSDGAFILSDIQSVAGTWVNYTPVSTMGVQLEHGDFIHIGRIAFRFELSVPPEQKKPRVISS